MVIVAISTVFALPKAQFGVDISHHNGKVNFKKLKKNKVAFVVCKATEGKTLKDKTYPQNVISAKKNGLIVGAYHFYCADTDPREQAANYIASVKLHSGDIKPVVDIESAPRKLSPNQFRKNLKIFLSMIEKRYKTVPIIYSGLTFYDTYLDGYGFAKYPSWIAAYNPKWAKTPLVIASSIHQTTKKKKISGKPLDWNRANLHKILIKKKNNNTDLCSVR